MKIKRILAALLASVMVLGLAACGGTPSGTSSSGQQQPSSNSGNQGQTSDDQVQITLATYPIGSWSDESVVNGLIADFNAAHPDIQVTVQYLDYANGDQTINAAIEAGTAPDIVLEGPERLIANWGAKGYMVDLSDLMSSEAGSQIYESVAASCTNAEGAVYEYPLCMTAHCMVINKDLFEAAGAMQYIDEETRTWSTEDFISAVEALVAYGQDPVAIVYCNGQGGDQGTRALVTNLYGGTFANTAHTEYTAYSPENVQALELLQSLEGINIDPSVDGTTEIQLFCNGTTAMAFCWNAGQEINNAETISFDAFPMSFPTESGEPGVLQGGIWGFGVFDNGDQAKIDAAKTFIQFMTEGDEYVKAVEATTYFPVRDVEGVYEGNELMSEYQTLVPYMGDYYQVTLGWTQARTEWWNMLQQIGSGADVDTALKTFNDNANAAAAAEAG